MNSIVGWVVQTMQGIVNAVSSFADEARGAAGSVASAIVSGITSGIENGASAIISAAKRAALAALDAAKSALGISSPSKVFATEVGKPMAQGMALGLTGSAPLVAGAAAATAGAAVDGGRSAASTTYSRTVNYSPTYNGISAPPEWDSALASVLAGV
jgi:phage-related protein